MELRTVRHLWGVEEAWETVFPKIKQNGYYAIETGLHFTPGKDHPRLKNLLNQYGLQIVVQLHTDSYEPGKRSKDLEHHLNNFRNQAKKAKEFGAIFCNSHSGYDGWNLQDKETFFQAALNIEQEIGIQILHETHRRRIFFNPWDTRHFVKKFPNLKLNADFSHWFVVCENDLDGELDVIRDVADRVSLIHARVGFDQGPQVNDPRTPENLEWVEAHERCWDIIWRAQHAKGTSHLYIEPEFGPPRYMHVLPFSNVPVSNLWDICEWQTKRQVERFKKFKW